jgi:hypothetical protein
MVSQIVPKPIFPISGYHVSLAGVALARPSAQDAGARL